MSQDFVTGFEESNQITVELFSPNKMPLYNFNRTLGNVKAKFSVIFPFFAKKYKLFPDFLQNSLTLEKIISCFSPGSLEKGNISSASQVLLTSPFKFN